VVARAFSVQEGLQLSTESDEDATVRQLAGGDTISHSSNAIHVIMRKGFQTDDLLTVGRRPCMSSC